MASTLKKSLKTVLPIVLGVFLVWYSIHSTSPENRKEILFYIKGADPLWVGISVLLGILGHVSRAIRWNYLLEPLGYSPRLINNVLIILTSYLANLGIPRTGEVLRATALTTYEKVPFEKGFGTIVTERVIDVIMLLFVVLTAFLLQTDVIMKMLLERGFNLKGLVLMAAIGMLMVAVFIFVIKKSKHPFAIKIKGFVKGLLAGIFSIFKMKHKWLFLLHTFFIWGCYIGMLWVIKFTVPETIGLSISQLLVAFVAGAFAMATTNGGVGLYPIAVSSALGIFGISTVSGDAFGWIIWIAQTLMIVVFGAISFLLLPLLNRNK
ncbi:MAG: lysylphosphatidylglycerol synthase transmembrane domain-containing protein [Maribacter sp.]